jgi:queuine tRNA-ribosyltransferase
MTGKSLDCEVVTTRLGAPAMLDRSTGEVMHPVVGPLVESRRLYVAPSRLAARLSQAGDGTVTLLDVGLGAGSNAAAALEVHAALPYARRLEVVSFDRSLAALALAVRSEHAAAFGFEPWAAEAAHGLLSEGCFESARLHWRVRVGELPHTLDGEPSACADVVFWDPFSPRSNPELWSTRAFVALRRLCRAGASVHTYSGATATRSALLLAGFAVGLGDGAGDKQQSTTVAALRADELDRPLDRRWLERLSRSSVPFPADAPADALARVAAHPQFGA